MKSHELGELLPPRTPITESVLSAGRNAERSIALMLRSALTDDAGEDIASDDWRLAVAGDEP